jgi:hypothetical protein
MILHTKSPALTIKVRRGFFGDINPYLKRSFWKLFSPKFFKQPNEELVRMDLMDVPHHRVRDHIVRG